MDRLVIAHTPLSSTLLFRSMQGFEGLSSLYHYSVELVSKDGAIDLKSLLGQSLSLQIKQTIGPDHWLNGDIISMGLKGMEGGSSRFYAYQADVRPRLWHLSQNKDFRLFQEQTVPDIILQVLSNYAITIDNRLSGNYRAWSYCVQYDESAFDFISRLMEHEGIYYFFKHELDKHTLVLVDSQDAHEFGALPVIPYRGSNASAIVDEASVDSWQVFDAITPNFVSMDDYDYHKPYASLLEVKENPASFATERTEVYEWPGRYIDQPHAQFYTRVRQQEKESQQETMNGSATTCALTPGNKISLIKAPRMQDNREYLLVQVNYNLWDNTYASGVDASRGQRCDFIVLAADINWRAPRLTAWPKTQGPQTARVVCPEGETIWTDKYGRVKVKFHWDRYAKGDDTSSCWIRVASAWAGQGYGGVQIPRLNDEVVVDFINGDPDRPIIIGRVYNDANMPPWDLPGNATQMGFFSRSKTGHKDTANILRFEDALGKEEMYLQAQKDMNTLVKDNQTNTVKDGNRTVTIETGNDSKAVEKGNLTETVCLLRSTTANAVQVNACAGSGGDGTQLYKATHQIKLEVEGSEIIMTPESITLSKGASKIIINDSGISLVGDVIHLNQDKG